MKIKACCIGTPDHVADVFSSIQFAHSVLAKVVGEKFGITDVLERPAEYYVQNADRGPGPVEGYMGVEVRMSGVTRNGRSSMLFQEALAYLVAEVCVTVENALREGERCQVFCVIMLDAEVETPPGSGEYSVNLESHPVWVMRKPKDRAANSI